jgi:predicted porin
MFKQKWASAAVLTLLSSVAAAQSAVTIYGRIDTGVVSGKFDPSGSRLLIQSGPYSASRMGFRGTEDLGGGMTAGFQMEMGLNVDTGAGGASGGGLAFNRGSQVSLAGGFGEVALGKMYMPIFWVYLASDPGIGGLGLGSMGASILQQHTALTGKTGFGGFYDNMVRYRSPDMSGVKGELAYSLGNEGVGATKNDARAMGANLQYSNGPMYLGGGYQKFTSTVAGTTAGTFAGDSNQTTWMLAGRYAIAPATIGVNYGKTTNSTVCLSAGNTVGCDMSTMAINSRWDVAANGSVDVSWASLKANSGALNGAKANTLALGYTHKMSKRTWLYAQYSKMNNNSASSWGLNGGLGLGNGTKGFSPDAMAVGIHHTF